MTKKIEEQSQKFLKTDATLKKNLKTLSEWASDWLTVRMLRCDESLMKIFGNSRKEKILLEILGKVELKLEKWSSNILSISWLNLCEKFSNKFIEVSRKVLGMNVAKILRRLLGNFR